MIVQTDSVAEERPVSMKYAHTERERRFLVGPQAPIPQSTKTVRIDDRYIIGTRLRLRQVTEPGVNTVWKFGQKVRFEPTDSTELAHTTMYLNEEEYAVLASLPATVLHKTRTLVSLGGRRPVAIDSFEGPLSGLVLAEIDADIVPVGLGLPGWLGPEVSTVEAFTGQALSCLAAGQLKDLLVRFGEPFDGRGEVPRE